MMSKFGRLSPRDVGTQFETKFSVGSYLAYQGDRFGERFDANSYVTLSMAMDLFDLGGTAEMLAASLRPARCRWLLASYTTDWLFPIPDPGTRRCAGRQRPAGELFQRRACAATTPFCYRTT
ncbi:MAG: hypothetical protein U0736_12010 [Gemmataceae bacterium]